LLLTSVAAVLGLVIIGTAVGFVVSFANVKREIYDANQQLAMLQPTVDMVENLQGQIRTMQSTEDDYKNLLNRQVTWSTLLYRLNAIAPSDLWLTEMDMTNADLSKDAASRQTSTAFPAAPGAPGVPGANGNVVAMSNAQGAGEPYPYPNEIDIKGMASGVTSIGIFARSLNQLPYFKSVAIKSIGFQTLNSQGNSSQTGGAVVNSSQVEANTFEIIAYLR
jgi:hypothetical protein